jgi:hypothetical protein
MNTLRAMKSAAASMLVALLFGCAPTNESMAAIPYPGTQQRVEGRLGATNVQAANVDPSVVEQLATASCDHEQGCFNIGNGQTYPSRDACMSQLRVSIENQLTGYCPRGVAQDGLSKCMSSIRTDSCTHSLQALVHEEHCDASIICGR